MYVFFLGNKVEAIENQHFDEEICAIIVETLLFVCAQANLLELSWLREKLEVDDHSLRQQN
jgi:hypothetical protein